MTSPTVRLLVFDGLADWEPAYALCAISRSGRFKIATVGFSREPVTSMGGLRLIPDEVINDVEPAATAILVMPGGDMWEQQSRPEVVNLLDRLDAACVPIAAICAATLEVARAGLTRKRRHTSNNLRYLRTMVPDYRDDESYVDELAVSDGGLITASGLGAIEFAREIMRQLRIHGEEEIASWFEMFKRGVIPAKWAQS
jgi:putative intracellular protease/amidase